MATDEQTNPEDRPYMAIGLMSGTSMDGVDAALVYTNGETVEAFGPGLTLPFEPEFRARLRGAIMMADMYEILALEKELTDHHVTAVNELLKVAELKPENIAIIGMHGQTVLHEPAEQISCQIGNPSLLAAKTGIPVVADMRRMDIALGGQGAPLVPVFHRAISDDLPKPLVFINIGGVSNLTYIGRDGALIGFDAGPGNAMINDYVKGRLQKEYDEDGKVAANGTVDEKLLAEFMSDAYFSRPYPKSLDRNHFAEYLGKVGQLKEADAVATLTEFSAASIALAIKELPEKPETFIVCGGGRKNATMVQALADMLGADVDLCENYEFNGDLLEAQAFAYLAMRSVRGLPLTYPETTGVSRAAVGGAFYPGVSYGAEGTPPSTD